MQGASNRGDTVTEGPEHSGRARQRRAPVVVVAIACLVAIVASACGSSSSSEQRRQHVRNGAGRSALMSPSPPDGTPKQGGDLIYGVEAESDGYNPWKNRFAASGTEVGLAVYDPLAAFDANDNTQPYLAQSMTPSADNMTWTITARPNIKFHNGQPLDGEAMRIFFEHLRADALVGIAFKPIDSVAVDPTNPLAVVITMKTPWATFPVFLTGQGGMVTAPAMADNPDSRVPIGTGPFKYVSWEPDKAFKAERNPDYWRKDANGIQLPYLDSVEFRPIPDFTVRGSSLEAGDLTMIHITDARSIQKFQQAAADGKYQIVLDRGEREEGFIMLNTSKPPLDDIRVRQALAYATDRNLINNVVNEGQREIGDGIFTQGSPWGSTSRRVSRPTRARWLLARLRPGQGHRARQRVRGREGPDLLRAGEQRHGRPGDQPSERAVGCRRCRRERHADRPVDLHRQRGARQLPGQRLAPVRWPRPRLRRHLVDVGERREKASR